MTLTMQRRPGAVQPTRPLATLNAILILAWRLGFGALLNIAPLRWGRLMILSTFGRHSGRARRVPLGYAPGDGCIYCLSGNGRDSDWFRNLMAQPRAQVWLPDGRWNVFARRVDDPEERLLRIRQVLANEELASSHLFGLDPMEASDEELRRRCAAMEVVRLSFYTRVRRSSSNLLWLLSAFGLAAWWGLRDTSN